MRQITCTTDLKFATPSFFTVKAFFCRENDSLRPVATVASRIPRLEDGLAKPGD